MRLTANAQRNRKSVLTRDERRETRVSRLFCATPNNPNLLAQDHKTKGVSFDTPLLCLSGYQDSNLGPSGPKPDALTGLRYTPLLYCECKGKANFLICKFFLVFFTFFLCFANLCHYFSPKEGKILPFRGRMTENFVIFVLPN